MEIVQIEDTAPQQEALSDVVDRLPDANLGLNQSRFKSVTQAAVALVVGCFTVMFAVRRGKEERRRAVEHGNIETTMSDEEVPDSIEGDQSTAADPQLNQSPVSSDGKSFIQMTVALALVGVAFCAMYNVPGGLNGVGRAVIGDTVTFIVFLVADTLVFHTTLAIVMIVATVSRISAKIDYLIHIALWAAAVCLSLTFHASAYVVVLPNQQWIVLCFGCVATIELALLILYRLSTMFC